MVYRSNDPLADFEKYDMEQCQMPEDLPECDYCGEPINTGSRYCELNDGIICEECLERYFMKTVGAE